ncbi:MAG TPA: hypothetical protein VI320_16135 [Terracidiphilus sp.]|jgi:hypothetical protein
MMRSSVSFFASLFAFVALAAPVIPHAQAQDQTQTPTQSTAGQPGGIGSYTVVDPLAGVRYDNRFDVSLGLAYDHMKAGPTLLQGSNLGGLDAMGSYWFSKHWGVEGSLRAYYGTSGAGPNTIQPGGIMGPVVSQYFFTAGPEWLGPHNKHGALIAHVLVGGVYGDFQQDLLGKSPMLVDFYNNQLAPAAIIGGHMDLNRSPRWVFRITPDAVLTHYGTQYAPKTSQFDLNFAISVGVEYKFKKKR